MVSSGCVVWSPSVLACGAPCCLAQTAGEVITYCCWGRRGLSMRGRVDVDRSCIIYSSLSLFAVSARWVLVLGTNCERQGSLMPMGRGDRMKTEFVHHCSSGPGPDVTQYVWCFLTCAGFVLFPLHAGCYLYSWLVAYLLYYFRLLCTACCPQVTSTTVAWGQSHLVMKE
jgi:hypothetical protein